MLNVYKELIIPAKTYLIGEYVSLHHGPSLILTHSPNFVCKTHEQLQLFSNQIK